MTEADWLDLQTVVERATFRAYCAKRTDVEWFVADELQQLADSRRKDWRQWFDERPWKYHAEVPK